MANPADPYFDDQYYLLNDVRGERDLGLFRNGEALWDDYTGKGVRVGVIDTGVDTEHEDLSGNYDALLAPIVNGKPADGSHSGSLSVHGTAVAGVIAAERNGIGIVGVAYDASFVSLNAVPDHGSSPRITLEQAFSDYRNLDVANNSWEFEDPFQDNPLDPGNADIFSALTDMVTLGRGGLGTIMVKAASNQGGSNGADLSGINNFWGAVTVAAVQRDGMVADYSGDGSAVLISAFGGEGGGDIVTTDRSGLLGYNGFSDSDYTMSFGGTSAAAPMVSGIVALMLEANPDLGMRDVQTILALTARHTGSEVGSGAKGNERHAWALNGADHWNGGGLHYSEDYGFGLVNAFDAVRLAETWDRQAVVDDQVVVTSTETLAAADAIDDFDRLVYAFKIATNIAVERVTLDLGIKHSAVGDLQITVISPSGTESRLLNNDGGSTDTPDLGAWDMSVASTAFLGEDSKGTWKVVIADTESRNSGSLDHLRLTLRGGDSQDDLYVFTDEFSDFATTARKKIDDDDGGTDGINAAAVSTASVIDLRKGGRSVIDGVSLTTSADVIETAVGGDGDDRLIGNRLDNRLSGERGDDHLSGGPGDDLLDGGSGWDIADYSDATGKVFVRLDIGDAQSVGADQGVDRLRSIEGLIGSDYSDRLDGDGSANTLDGGDGNDRLFGLGGDDILSGGAGRNKLYGGPGDDLYIITTTGDHALEERGEGNDTVRTAVSFTLDARQEVELVEGTGTRTTRIRGNELDNHIIGSDARNALYGRDGNDRLEGAGGNDRLVGEAGRDILIGGVGNDTYYVDSNRDQVIERRGEGDDRVYTTVDYRLDDDSYVELLKAQRGSDASLYGNDMDNTIIGSRENNRIDGGGGADILKGGGGFDLFVFVAGEAHGDIIRDFSGRRSADGDELLFKGYGSEAAGASLTRIDDTHWRITSANGSLHETLILANGASIDHSDYVFA